MKSSDTQMELVRRYLGGEATLEEARRLESMLAVDAQLRRDYLAYARVEAGLSSKVRPKLVKTASPARWFAWRPLTAAAAGIVFGMFCTSMLFAYAVPRLQPLVNHALALANAGFEERVAPTPEGVPVRYAVWSGDFAEIVEAQQGIRPREGRRMLRFLRSDSSVSPEPEKNVHGNLYQVVDMRSYRNEIADGQASVDWSAWFNWVPGDGEKGMKFMTSVWAFTGDTSILPVNWKDHLYLETAKNSRTITVDDAPKTWRQIAGRMIVPPDTDFLVIELKAMPNSPAQGVGPYRFSGCFTDDVQLILQTQSRTQSVAKRNATY